jgi:hypothetical protein
MHIIQLEEILEIFRGYSTVTGACKIASIVRGVCGATDCTEAGVGDKKEEVN